MQSQREKSKVADDLHVVNEWVAWTPGQFPISRNNEEDVCGDRRTVEEEGSSMFGAVAEGTKVCEDNTTS